MKIQNNLLTVEEAAEMLRLSKSYTFQLIREGSIEHIRIGKRIFLKTVHIEDFLSQQTVKREAL
jgi:excisionase family DNA binding protein